MTDLTSESLKPSSSPPLDNPDRDLCPYAPAPCRCPVPKDSNGRYVRPYVVYPKDGNIVNAATQQLESFEPQSETQLEPHMSLGDRGVLYWKIRLTQDQATELRKNPDVRIY
ncbi:hypothetical protein ACMFMG_001277 [Clarireedia jacksonii]